VLVTADHGRGRDWRHHGREFPESGRVWLVAFGAAVQARGLVPATRKHHLADVAPTLRQLLGLPPDEARSAGAPIEELFDTGRLATAALTP
jgi:arylsulfatase A-like enzyme